MVFKIIRSSEAATNLKGRMWESFSAAGMHKNLQGGEKAAGRKTGLCHAGVAYLSILSSSGERVSLLQAWTPQIS